MGILNMQILKNHSTLHSDKIHAELLMEAWRAQLRTRAIDLGVFPEPPHAEKVPIPERLLRRSNRHDARHRRGRWRVLIQVPVRESHRIHLGGFVPRLRCDHCPGHLLDLINTLL